MNTFLHCGDFRLPLERPLVMGIINATPDSFSGDGVGADAGRALAQARQFIADGADVLDIGGESTRPGSDPVSAVDEIRRVVPVIEALGGLGVPLSIDTWKPEVMRAALAAGATMVNDINGLQAPGAIEAVAASDAAVCIMHMQGTPQTMQVSPFYADVCREVTDFLLQRAACAQDSGIDRARIMLDPGFGFGKTSTHNLELINGLQELAAQGYPLLVGLSRKSVLGSLTGRKVTDRVAASVAAALASIARGARMVRVHDVAATRDAIAVWQVAGVFCDEV
ncbi:MAG: dihydropteroate synthase [Gammaproteobacteria bacterium]|jgi:dihydropteroate synthase|nr:dihydropteroate synthase [Gammaproteobacteria bacterium]MBU0770233.1 dihydropteroate synthase [Gammaproteobacteria bacterium]MBU0857302.1 dihydropteroate synthase [Gammaproteobacteria bacterium]MBU1846267.1 dihydropteroate synthase [Gammaproteobacteria bacterium]